jgi:putative dimethyl sulfoxide reductase chaperone
MTLTAESLTELLQRAAVARGLALALAQPDAQTPAAVADALRQGSNLPEHDVLEAAAQAWSSANAADLAEEHTRLFAGSCPCPPYETAWGDGRRMAGRTYELASIAGAYRAFGFELSDENRDKPDLAATELEFLSLLLLKLGWAGAERLDEAAAITREALVGFVEQHVGRWLHALAKAVETQGAGAAYLLATRAAAEFLSAECNRLGANPTPVEGIQIKDAMQADCLSCPMAKQE